MDAENGDGKSKLEDYEGVEQIGRGSFGATFVVLHKAEKKKYVLKKIRLSKMTEKFKGTAVQEINLIAKLQHPHIVQHKDAWVEKGNCICVVTDYYEGGSISERISKAKGAYFPEEKLCKWLTQMLLAIDYLHTNRVVHRNIKLSNIFVTKENDILLGDFGLGKILDEQGLSSTVSGTPNYMCPELLENIPYGYKSDIWSLGCCIFEIAAHQQAFKALDMAGLINKINKSLISPFPYMYSLTLKQIIKSMLRKSPEHRPTAAELLRHSHLKPFLLRCQNLPTVFLPVKSPSPNSSKGKSSSTSPINPDAVKDSRETDTKPKQKELLPLFEENTDVEYVNLLDEDHLIEDKLETKRVDPTSYSDNISHHSEDSKSGSGSYETTSCRDDDQETCDSSLHKESFNAKEILVLLSTALSKTPGEKPPNDVTISEEGDRNRNRSVGMTTLCCPRIAEEKQFKEKGDVLENCNNRIASAVFEEVVMSSKETVVSKGDSKQITLNAEDDTPLLDEVKSEVSKMCLIEDMAEIKEDGTRNLVQSDKKGIQLMDGRSSSDGSLANASNAMASDNVMKIDLVNGGNLRENALESLLELCARLLKQDKLDELTGVLKAFGDETVSSRETAIWLAESLINAQKIAKES